MADAAERRRMMIGCAALLALSFALYAPSSDFGFISYDDRTILLSHPELYAVESPVDAFEAIVLSHFPREEPLLVRDLSWWLDAQLFGFESARGYHAGNVLYNAVAVVLFALWLFSLRPDWRRAIPPAMLFAAIPVHVEPVAWVMGRKDLLSACLSLAVLILHVVYLRADGVDAARRRRRLAYAGTLLLYPLAVLGKFNALLLVPALALQDLFFPYLTGALGPRAPMPWRRLEKAALSLLPHAALAVLLYLFYSWNLSQMGITTDRGAAPLSAEHIGTLASFLPWVIALYARNLVTAAEHSIFYPWPNTDLPMTTADLLGAAGIVTALLLAAVILYRRRKDVFFFFAALFVLMVPYANIVYIGIWVADRYVYLTSGLAITAVVWGVLDMVRTSPKRWVRLGSGASGLLLLLFWLLSTLTRVPVFADDVSLFGYEVERENPSMLAYGSLVRAKLRLLRDAPPDEQAALLSSIEADIERGIAHYEAQPWQRNDTYVISDHLYYAKLLVFSNIAMTLRGVPPGQRLPLLLRAHEAQPHPATAEALAEVYLQMCQGAAPLQVEEYSRRSLQHFADYVGRTLAIPTTTAEQREVLRGRVHEYYDGFPHLASEVEAIEELLP